MLRTKVKASAITNLTDARYFAAWEVVWLGFNLEVGHENFMSPRAIKAMKEWVDGVKIVGEFGLSTATEIRETVDFIELDAIQLGMFTEVALLEELRDLTIIKEVIIDQTTKAKIIVDHLQEYSYYCSHFLLNFDKNGIIWQDLANDFKDTLVRIAQSYSIIISMDFLPAELDEIIDTIQPFGLNVKGGDEEKVGFKSFDELDEVFEALEILV